MSKRILVVDDDPMIRMLVKDMLEAEGFSITIAEDGEQGLGVLQQEADPADFSLVILDVIMPGMNGLQMLTKLKDEDSTKAIPVIMLTGEDKTEDILAGYNVGADYYITKPFTRQQLLYGLQMVMG